MKEKLDHFINQFDDFYSLSKTEQIDVFGYFLEDIEKLDGFSPTNIKTCFELSKVKPYSNIPSYLTKNLKAPRGKKPKYLKSKNRYSLNAAYKVQLVKIIPDNKPKAKTSKTLRDLLVIITDNEQNVFLDEAIKCFEINAFRASIVMVWNLTVDHLSEYILSKKLSERESLFSISSFNNLSFLLLGPSKPM